MFAENIRIFLLLSSWLGVMPFYQQNKKRFRIVLYIPIVCILLCTFAIFRQIIWIYFDIISLVVDDVWLVPLVSLFCYIHIIITLNAKRDLVQNLFDSFNDIDFNLQQIFKIKPAEIKYIPLGMFLVNFIFIFMLGVDYYWYGSLDDGPWTNELWFYLGVPWSTYNQQISEFVKVLIINAIWKRFRILNGLLIPQGNVLTLGPKNIDDFIKLHSDCSDLVDIFNDIYGLTVFISIIQTVLNILRLCLIILDHTKDPTLIWFVFVWSAYAIVSIKYV